VSRYRTVIARSISSTTSGSSATTRDTVASVSGTAAAVAHR
jgi:hypothetical protein